jgi:hypothetical protein
MDATYFLKQRVAFVRFFYVEGAKSFQGMQDQIEQGLPPFDNPPYSEDAEPAFLDEWQDAATSIEVLGQSSVSLLADALKLYFQTLQRRVIGFTISNEELSKAKRRGWVALYRDALAIILDTDWADCPARFDIIEQVVLARNSSQHGTDLTSQRATHDARTLEKHPRPWFASDDEVRTWEEYGGNPRSFLVPRLTVTEDNLFAAAREIEVLADWIDGRLYKATEWRLNVAR